MSPKSLLIALALALLAGCGSVKRQAYNREGASAPASLSVGQQKNQPEYEVAVLAHPGISFGLIGGLIAIADAAHKSKRVSEAIDPDQVRLQVRFAERLAERLGQGGWSADVVPLGTETNEEQVLQALKRTGKGSAALLVDVVGKFLAAGPTTDYFPYVAAKVKLVDTASGATLYEDMITYGYSFSRLESVQLPAPEADRFANVDALVLDPARTRQTLWDGIDAIVEQIARDLKRGA